MNHPFGFALLATLAATIVQAVAGADTPAPPLTVVGQVEMAPQSWPGIVDRGGFVFSQYDPTGNSYEIVALDFRDQRVTTLATGIREGRFLARDDRHVVIADRRPPATRIRVFDISTGEALARINLRDGASWARIDGDGLHLIQEYAGSRGSTKVALFELATLKLLRSVEIGPAHVAASWGEKIVTVGQEVRIFDRDWNLTGTLPLPRLPPGRMYCAPTQLLITGNLAVANVACGKVAVFDLQSRKLKHLIAIHTQPVSIAVANDLLVAVPIYSRDKSPLARIFDLETGRLLGMLPVDGSRLAADGDRLIAIRRLPYPTSRLTIYSINDAAIRSAEWQEARILAECGAAAETFAFDGDEYSAADRCDEAGVAALTRERWRDPAFASVIRNYGSWLAAGLDRYREAVPFLEASNSADTTSHEVEAELADARLKVRLLDMRSPDELTADDRRTPFGAAVSRADEQLRSQWVSLDFIVGGTKFLFSDDRFYAVRWSCDELACDVKPRLDAFDRDTLQSVGSTAIPTEGSKNGISSIAAHEGEIWVAAAGEETEAAVNDTFVLDARSLRILRKGRLESGSASLFSRDGMLFACDCESTGTGTCDAVDPQTFARTPTSDWGCDRSSSRFDPLRAPNDTFPPFIEAATPNYFAVREPDGSEGSFFAVQPRLPGAVPPLLDKYRHRRFDHLVAIPGSEKLLVRRYDADTISILEYDIATGMARTLARVANVDYRPVAMIADERRAYVSIGRDFAIIDIASGELRYYVRDLTPAGASELIRDGHWLMAFPSGGGAVSVLDLRPIQQ